MAQGYDGGFQVSCREELPVVSTSLGICGNGPPLCTARPLALYGQEMLVAQHQTRLHVQAPFYQHEVLIAKLGQESSSWRILNHHEMNLPRMCFQHFLRERLEKWWPDIPQA